MPPAPTAELGDSRTPRSSGALGWTVAAVGLTVLAGVAVSYGLALKARPWLVVGTAVFAPVLVSSAHGAAARMRDNRRAAVAATIGGLCIIFIATITVTSPWWEKDGATTRGRELFIASTDASAHVYLHRSPGAPELAAGDPEPLEGGHGYEFSCEVTLADASRWLRLAQSHFWAPADALRTAQGRVPGRLSSC